MNDVLDEISELEIENISPDTNNYLMEGTLIDI